MRAVILGATRGMGRALARQMAARGDALFLLGRDEEQLSRSARDLEIRGAASVGTARCDLSEPEGFAAALDAAQAGLGALEVVIVTAALFGTQEELEADPARATRLLTVNLANTVALCEAARARMLARGGGTLCVFSSVAGDRSRKPVGIYGASKAGLSHYLESLDLRYRAQGLKVVCVKPGFVKTGMTAGLPAPPFAGEPEAVARAVLAAVDRGQPLVYAPGIWRLIMGALRHTPRAIMRRVNF
jgi:decaprenylphospho-beta-D-erythro-pentofuranosid-2-ulose 2-reductase